MESRVLIAYILIALMVAAAGYLIIRERERRKERRRSRRGYR